jgi:hypothetical protein
VWLKIAAIASRLQRFVGRLLRIETQAGGMTNPALPCPELKPLPIAQPTLLYGARCASHGALFLFHYKSTSLRAVMRPAVAECSSPQRVGRMTARLIQLLYLCLRFKLLRRLIPYDVF